MTWIISVLCLIVGYAAGARHAMRPDREQRIIDNDTPEVNTIEYAYTGEDGEDYYYIRPKSTRG